MGAKGEPSSCVVCRARGKPHRDTATRMSRVTIEARTLTLCREHAGLVAIAMPKTWDELRAVLSLPTDRRSPVPRRREAEDRRVFPPRPEGRRTASGRRHGDPVD